MPRESSEIRTHPPAGPAAAHCVESVPQSVFPQSVFQQCPAPPVSLSSAHRPRQAPPPGGPRWLGRRCCHAGALGHCRWRGVGARVGAAGGRKGRLIFLSPSPPTGLPALVARRIENRVTGVCTRTDRRSLATDGSQRHRKPPN
jgi:hypothetical protein